MHCKNCGKILNQGELFCANCGTRVEQVINYGVENNIVQENNIQSFSNIDEINHNINSSVDIPSILNINELDNGSNENIEMSSISNIDVSNSYYNQNIEIGQTNIPPLNAVNKNSKKSLVSLIIGIVSIILSFMINIFVIPLAIVGLVFGIIEKNKSGKKTAGIILNIASIVLPIIISIFSVVLFGNIFSSVVNNVDIDMDNSIFSGDGYKLTYDDDWVSGTVSSKDALSYEDITNSYFLPIGKSALTEHSCDFSDSSCKTKLYDDFYEYWSKDLNSNSIYLYKDSYSFNLLKDDIYYASYKYGKSSTEIKGKYYLLVSKEKNVVLSFMFNCDTKDVSEMSEEVLELFRTIELEQNSSSNSNSNVVYDDELYNYLDSMSNWNMYSDLRTGDLGKIANITGGWRILSTSESYWEFKNNEFYWYKSLNNLNDNYWHGTTTILTGKAGLKSVGLDENKVDDIISRSNGSITASDIYAIICTPTKIISNGEDKSDTNIPADSKWNYIWIVIDHGTEGIEAQILNVDSSETAYYVKIKD